MWIVGGALESWRSWDVDVIMQKATPGLDYEEIEKIMTDAMRIGLEIRQLIDIHFQQRTTAELFGLTQSFWGLNLEDFTNLNLEHEVLQLALEVTKNGVVSREASTDPVQVGQHLWRVKKRYPAEKHIVRKRRGILYEKDPVLLTRDLDFRKIINIGEQHV
tara:strand:+ start:4930 stop:5412 length:483 start_codon:yes stop_codon:yes gene_type:complete